MKRRQRWRIITVILLSYQLMGGYSHHPRKILVIERNKESAQQEVVFYQLIRVSNEQLVKQEILSLAPGESKQMSVCNGVYRLQKVRRHCLPVVIYPKKDLIATHSTTIKRMPIRPPIEREGICFCVGDCLESKELCFWEESDGMKEEGVFIELISDGLFFQIIP